MDTTNVALPPKPEIRPGCPNFSSGPCAKYPGYDPAKLSTALTGQSHRGTIGRARLSRLIDETRSLIELPDDYLLALVPGSDTGAFELAMWNLLGARGVDVLAWENFGQVWLRDVTRELKLQDVRIFDASYGALPDLSKVDFSRDVIFTANGTTSGVRIPNYDWIAPDRKGLTLVDATSAILAQPVDWAKADVVTFSWQKVLGGEAAHGMIALSPRAVRRLEIYRPAWPIPKLFRVTNDGKLNRALFDGETINTPSMLCVEDCLKAIAWAKSAGGRSGLELRCSHNAQVLFNWIDRTSWIANLAKDRETWSNTSVCLTWTDKAVTHLSREQAYEFSYRVAGQLARHGVAFDIASYRTAPPGLRIWTGATVETSDVEALLPWIEWAYATELHSLV